MKKVAVFISGGGSNMVSLVEAMLARGKLQPVLVLANDPKAKGLAKASALGVATTVVNHKDFGKDRATFEKALIAQCQAVSPDIICLAGFMRILTPLFVDAFKDKVLNIHPSLLPKYPGLHTHARAIAAGDDNAGCSVHLVTAELDAGPILGQATVPVLAEDTPQSLAARVLTQEHKLYPEVLHRFADGNLETLTIY